MQIHHYGIRFIEKQNENYDYIIISNADIEVEENAIDKCLQVLEVFHIFETVNLKQL